MSDSTHHRIEALAGAIALGEASDEERQEYRSHISACARCLRELGGEREIERTAAHVAQARDAEVWQPNISDAIASRMQRRARRLRFTFGVAGMCLAASFGLHVLLVGGLAGVMPKAQPAVINIGTTRIVLEQRSSAQSGAPLPAPTPAPARRTYVAQHNVVIMQRAISAPAAPALKAEPQDAHQIASVIVHPQADYATAKPRNVPSWHTVATSTTTSLTETAPQSFTHNAESMQFGPVKASREASPIGGETAIDPKPPMIAYDEGAEGTAVFEVLVDERGNPTRCVITKSSGYAVLDDSVCKAAMSTKYAPKVQDGRAVAGVYHDAFTFRMQEDPGTEGLPQDAHIPNAGPAHTPSPHTPGGR